MNGWNAALHGDLDLCERNVQWHARYMNQELNDDPEGMTHIIACLQNIRRAIPTLPAGLVTAGLQAAAAEIHGVTFVQTRARV